MQDNCWIYAGATTKDGYGKINLWVNGRKTSVAAHRAIYEDVHGAIEPPYEVDHLCSVRACINPKHLVLATHIDNMQRRFGVGLCKRGHTLTPDNVYVHVKDQKHGRIGRQCKQCKLNRAKEQI